jgi:hypothetical protein
MGRAPVCALTAMFDDNSVRGFRVAVATVFTLSCCPSHIPMQSGQTHIPHLADAQCCVPKPTVCSAFPAALCTQVGLAYDSSKTCPAGGCTTADCCCMRAPCDVFYSICDFTRLNFGRYFRITRPPSCTALHCNILVGT